MKKVPLFKASSLPLCLLMTACGSSGSPQSSSTPITASSPINLNSLVIKAKASMPLTAGESETTNSLNIHPLVAYNASPSPSPSQIVGITVTNAPSTTMTISTASLQPPTITNTLLSFGSIQVATLEDNNLDVCGTNGNTHCGTGLILMYTTGTAAAGLYDSVDQFGAPISAGQNTGNSTLCGLDGLTCTTVGLGANNAAVVQTISIPASQHVITLANFPSPNYELNVDFTNAGAGTYATTLVVEYALSN